MKIFFKQLITHPLFSGSAIMIFGLNSINFLNYLYHFVMGRMLGPGNYGELASLVSLVGLVGIIPSSISLMIVKYVSSENKDEDRQSLIRWFRAKIFQVSIFFSICILITAPFIGSFLKIQSNSYLILIALSFLFSTQSGLNRAILQGLLKFKEMVASILFENASKLFLSIFLVFLGFQVNGAMIALIVSAVFGLYVTNIYLRVKQRKGIELSPDLKSMFKFIIPVTIQSIAITSLYSSDVILVKHFFPAHEAGIYASLSTLGKIIFFGAGPIGAVMFPIVSQRKAKGENYEKIFIYSFIATGVFAAGILLFYWVFPSLAINLLYGSAYLEAKNLLVWFGIFMTLFTLSTLLINFNLSLGKTRVVLLPLAASLVQILAINFYHKNLFIIVALSTLITALLLTSLLIYSSYGKRLYKGN